MPVAIRSLNGYYGFLDSLRSLEMTTVTEQIPIYRAPSNRVRRGELCSPAIGTGWFSSAGDHRSPLRCYTKLLDKSKLERLRYILWSWEKKDTIFKK